MNPWVALFSAGLLEVGFTSFMVLSAGFTKWIYVLFFLACAIGSFVLLAVSMRSIPMGTAYALWTGTGALGTAIIGILFFKDPANFGRIFFLTTLILSIIGLKLASPGSP